MKIQYKSFKRASLKEKQANAKGKRLAIRENRVPGECSLSVDVQSQENYVGNKRSTAEANHHTSPVCTAITALPFVRYK